MNELINDAIRQLAIDTICPLSGEPVTPYERGMVKNLHAFGLVVVQRMLHLGYIDYKKDDDSTNIAL